MRVSTKGDRMTTLTNEWARSVDERLTRIETRLEGFDERFANKADLAELETRLIKWMVGLMVGAIVAASSIAVLTQRLTG